MSYLPGSHELVPQAAGELRSIVSGNGGWDAKYRDYAMCECIGNSGRRDVCEWNSDGPSGHAIDGREQVMETIGFWHFYEVDVPMVESLLGNDEFADWLHRVSGDFCLLAW